MKLHHSYTIVFFLVFTVTLSAYTAQETSTMLYKDASQSIEKRVEDLLSRMTLEEKVGQINMPCVYVNELGREIEDKLKACPQLAKGTYAEGIGPIGGFFTLANTILHKGPKQQAEYFNELQKIALEETRLGIPLLQTEEGTHGLMCSGGTIFPEGLTLGSMWNPELIEHIYTIAAREARAVGIHQLFTLVVEPNRDPRLGRNQEGYSEDPFLISEYARRIVHAVQGQSVNADDKVVAGLCHYPGQSQPASGLERGAMEISERMLRTVFLPPWVAGIKEAGALGVMATYPAIDGVPAHASDKILTKILRDELNFQGLVLSEGSGIETVIYEGLAPGQKEAGQIAMRAGLDVGISYESGYMQDMAESVNEGKVSEELLDRALRRVLTQKFKLGLFEKPYVDVDHAVAVSHTPKNQDTALMAAREGIVLLKNDNNLLPLKQDIRSIAVIGPNADNPKNQLGDYTSIEVLQDIVTVLDGIKSHAGRQTQVNYVKGCDVIGEKLNEIDKAVDAAKQADVAIVILGENEWRAPNKTGTNGEGYDVASLDLTGLQEDLLRAVQATGTPTVLVLINGRPLSIRWAAENVPAIVEAWLPGEKGGDAVGEILFGQTNPSGRLPITLPRHVGQLPAYYNYKPSKEYWITKGWGKHYADMDAEPLWEFGFGLSYTTFEYSNLKIDKRSFAQNESIDVSVDVKNTGDRQGSEVAQLYIRDLISTVTTPIMQLRGFKKVILHPKETSTVTFTLKPEDLALLNQDMKWVVEPGEFEIMVGSSSKKIHARERVEVEDGDE